MRYLPLTDADRRDMLATIGVPSVDSLFRDVPSVRLTDTVNLPDHQGELEVEQRLAQWRRKTYRRVVCRFFSAPGLTGIIYPRPLTT